MGIYTSQKYVGTILFNLSSLIFQYIGIEVFKQIYDDRYQTDGSKAADGINSYSRKRARWRIAGLSP